ncbi:MAG TPA: long-chain fatty acid--CoA ligase [Acidiphilium sp.]|nr:MAG: dicarboxylate--CoA ligase PimA [Acidiphilium sp. 21-60-14]OZB39950.1 MAG: dicarboxylate--CoA ligase PimA [Acidiphilium sp. 34-60-192]HQT87015.1 long-chain fatty acid--CoA ligase [Acidiphilium sp.]HQU22938.1 long-chain fatty acid--CoA ligase [Acidiphilium sp.]
MGSTTTVTPMAQADFKAVPHAAGSMLDEAARRFGARPAVDFLGRGWNWSEMAALADRAAAGLQQRGVVKGTRVGLCLPNTHYFIVMYYAILKAGGTVVNFNPLYTERELAAQAQSAGTRIMVSLDVPMIQDKISALVAQGLLDQVIVCSMAAALPTLKSWAFRLLKSAERAAIPAAKPYVRFSALIAGPAKPTAVAIDPLEDIAALQFTGGTTGVPKAAMLTHGNITANVQQVLAGSPPLVEGGERIIGVLPFFHVFAMTAVMNLGVSIGAELVLMPRLDIKMLMAAIQRKRPTIVPGVPTLFTAISNAAGTGMDLSFIKFCISGGAAIAAEAAERFERLSRCAILEGYGLSEASPVVTATPPDKVKRNSVGIALPGTIIEIRDPEHPERILPQGEKGEICVRGPQVMKGYLDRPDETAKAMIDGALRTGDIGYIDADGYLFIVDRIKDLILCSGYNVYPRVIEEAAYQHPAVQDAIAIGIPDSYRGQAPKLFVTLRPGASATEAEILEFLKAHLNKIEIPKAIEIRDSLPKTLVGKLSKKELVAEEAAKPQVIKAFFDDQSSGTKAG